MKWFKKLKYYLVNEHVRLVKATLAFKYSTESGNTLLSNHIPIKIKNISLICLNDWNCKQDLLDEFEKKVKKGNNDIAKKLLQDIRKTGYYKRDVGVFVKGKHIIECSWGYYDLKWKKLTYDEWRRVKQ